MAKTYDFYGERFKISKLPTNKPVKILQVYHDGWDIYFIGLKGAIYSNRSQGGTTVLIRDDSRYENSRKLVVIVRMLRQFGCISKEKGEEFISRMEKTNKNIKRVRNAQDLKFLAEELDITLTKAQLKKLGKGVA